MSILGGGSWRDVELFSRAIPLLLGILGLAYLLSLVSAAKEFLGQPQTPLLLVAPLKPSSLLWAKYLAVLADRNLELAIIVLGVPCLLAMRRIGLAHALYLFPSFFAGVLLVNMVAVATILFMVRYLWHRRKTTLWLGASLLTLLLVWIMPTIYKGPVSLVPGTVLDTLQRWQLEFVSRPFLTTMAWMLVLLLVLWSLAWLLSRTYVPAWSRLQETKLVMPGADRRANQLVSGLVYRFRSLWWGATWAVLLKDWRTMGRSPLFPLRVLVLLSSWTVFLVVREWVDVQSPLLAIPFVVAGVLLCLQVAVGELAANAFAGEANRLSLILTTPHRPWRVLRAKLVAHGVPVLLMGATSALVVGVLVSLPPLLIGLGVLLTCLITAANTALLVGGSVLATDLSVGVSGIFEEILFEETFIAPNAACRMAVVGISVAFQVANVALLCLPYWLWKEFDSLNNLFWGGLTSVFVVINGVIAFGALRVGIVAFNRLTME